MQKFFFSILKSISEFNALVLLSPFLFFGFYFCLSRAAVFLTARRQLHFHLMFVVAAN